MHSQRQKILDELKIDGSSIPEREETEKDWCLAGDKEEDKETLKELFATREGDMECPSFNLLLTDQWMMLVSEPFLAN